MLIGIALNLDQLERNVILIILSLLIHEHGLTTPGVTPLLQSKVPRGLFVFKSLIYFRYIFY
jgi:hypothetical protein